MSSIVDDSFRNQFGGYSQYGEDIPLKNILPENGYFLEIGAFCPYTFSNTRFLVEKGWSGCYVDGCPYAMSRFLDTYKDNESITLVQSLIGEENKLVYFYNSLRDAVSTTDTEFMQKWKDGGSIFKKMYANMITIETLKEILPSTVDFINIDVEGQSAKLAMLIDYEKFNTKCVCVEHDNQIASLQTYFKKYKLNLHWYNHTNAIFAIN